MLRWYSGGFFTLSLSVCLDLSSGDTAKVLALVTLFIGAFACILYWSQAGRSMGFLVYALGIGDCVRDFRIGMGFHWFKPVKVYLYLYL
jgi:cellulose synthase/poly-beta-1,6-N-acetylglucosamine synthase-like glycosyltransferase